MVVGRGLVGGITVLVALALAPQASADDSTSVQDCQDDACEEIASIPVGENTVSYIAISGAINAICAAPSTTPVVGVGQIGVCDQPPPSSDRTLLRVAAADQEVALEGTSAAAALLTSSGLGLRFNNRRIKVETTCSAYPSGPAPPPSYCAPFGLLETP